MKPDAFVEVGLEPASGRPAWVRRDGARRIVTDIEADRIEPERRLWQVRLQSGERVLLIQRTSDRRWSVTSVTPPYGPAAV